MSKKTSKTSATISRTKRDGNSGGSWILCTAWSFILGWFFFLIYCWQSGHLHADIHTLELVEEAIVKTESSIENSLRGSLEHIHIGPPIVHQLQPQKNAESIVAQATQPVTEDPSDLHIVFSTDCTPYQDWQTLLMFYSAVTIGQKGPITRIASGCDDAKKEELTALYHKLYPQYHVHFTPDFKKDEKTQQSCKFDQVILKIKHWQS